VLRFGDTTFNSARYTAWMNPKELNDALILLIARKTPKKT